MNPLRRPAFRRLYAAQVIALVGTGLSTVALTLLAYDLVGGNAGVVLGTAMAFKMVAYVVFAPIVGGLVHRFSRKTLLISLDVMRAGIVLLMPFVTAVWQIYVLIFLLNLFSAGFKPVFAATIPDILPDEREYTQALSFSRLAYDLENLLSPMFAGVALLFMGYSSLFMANSVAFLISAVLVLATTLPVIQAVDRPGGLWWEISFGIRSYMRTPRLRGLLAFYLAVSAASAMIVVNTVVYVREVLGGTESDTAVAFAASGAGSMVAALVLPRVLDRISDRPAMLTGCAVMALGMFLMSTSPGLQTMLAVWFLVGVGWSLVQTPAGRVVNRSSSESDRSAYFSAQFALSHGCWLLAYPVAGQLGAAIGIGTTAMIMGGAVLVFGVLGAILWPTEDPEMLDHHHEAVSHTHLHSHDPHHQHEHAGWEGPEPHRHPHEHLAGTHRHTFVIDDHHAIWPQSPHA